MAKAAPGYTRLFANALAEAGLVSPDVRSVRRIELTLDANDAPKLVVTSYIDPNGLDKVIDFVSRQVTYEVTDIQEGPANG